MARKIVVMEQLGVKDFRVAYWLDVPIGRQNLVADANKTSQVKDISQTELTDFRAGKFVEMVEQRNYPSTRTIPQILSDLQSRHAELQAEVDAVKTYQYYGSFWDGTSWTQKSNP